MLLDLLFSGLGHELFMSRVLFGLMLKGLLALGDIGEIGEGSKALGVSVRNGVIICIARVRGEDWAARRRRRPTSNSVAATKITKRMYAPMIEPIWAGRKEKSRTADAAMGGPSSGDGAGPSKILTCQIEVGNAWVSEIKSAASNWNDEVEGEKK